MNRLIRLLPAAVVLMALMALPARADAPPGPFFQGFETDTSRWFDLSNGGDGSIARQPSGYMNVLATMRTESPPRRADSTRG